MKIGIDFGTCFSCVTLMAGKRPITNFMPSNDEEGIPTKFMYSKKLDKELFGLKLNSSEFSLNHYDEMNGVISNMKRIIRENPNNLDKTVISNGKSYTIKEILKKYLSYLLAETKSGVNNYLEIDDTGFERITITAPVGIAKGQMTATGYNELLVDTLVDITGLDKEHINVLPEPVAAAVWYSYRKELMSEDLIDENSEKETILVFDLGGGTLDVTILEYDPSKMEYAVKVKEGDLNLGGNNWDEALAKAVLGKLEIEEPFEDPLEEYLFKSKIENCKRILSKDEFAGISFRYKGVLQKLMIERDNFESKTKNLLDRAIELTKKAIDSYDDGLSGIDKIVLVGGSSNMPQILNRMLEEFSGLGSDKILIFEPSHAISKGAAIYSRLQSISKEDGKISAVRPAVIDIAAHTYGVDYTDSRTNKAMIHNIIFKGTPFEEDGKIAVKDEWSFIPYDNFQKRLSYIVYESDAENGTVSMPVGSGELANGMEVTVSVPEEYLGKAREYATWVELVLDANGILEIKVTDEDGNQVGYDKKQI